MPRRLKVAAVRSLLSVPLLAAALALGSAVSAGTSAAPPAPAPAAPRPASTPGLFRIVGCRSHGDVAYLHGPASREVAIGFDDGPWPDTPAFVTMLEHSHARATFFMIGRQITAAYRSTLLRELRNGDVLGDHTFTHPYLTQTGDVYGQLEDTIRAIRALTGYSPCVFRPPYGAYNASIIRTARSLGLATVLWSVDPSDYTLPGTAVIEARVLAQVRPGSIIISHDGGGPRAQTLAAYPGIIAALRRRGYRIVTIPELLGFHPLYVPCIRLCDGIGVPRSALPAGAIVERATGPRARAAGAQGA
ncbi:MAG TPA: polysaccharide deacetylase family protein [Solirubrobacteraceae bacterium]|nr:polysaccharide deacetylase family protein [Solirubrobacteraceae bacterium]